MKAQVTIDIPEGYELTEPELRSPKKGDTYLCPAGHVKIASMNYQSNKYPILRKKLVFEWPSLLKGNFLARSSTDDWFLFRERPIRSARGWISPGKLWYVNLEMLNITLPDCKWEDSLIERIK